MFTPWQQAPYEPTEQSISLWWQLGDNDEKQNKKLKLKTRSVFILLVPSVKLIPQAGKNNLQKSS